MVGDERGARRIVSHFYFVSRRMRYIAFLRAINIGGRFVKMDKLRQPFVDLGLNNVETFITSGNIIFDAPNEDPIKLERAIETQLQTALGFWVDTFVRATAEIEAVSRYEPFPLVQENETLNVAFLPAAPDEIAVQKALALHTTIDELHIFGREVYWLRHSIEGSKFSGARLERALKMPATIRTQGMVKRLAAKYPHITTL